MARARAAQAVKVQQVTHASSIELACSLLQVGVADICHARGILPDEDFVNVKIQGLEKIETKSIRSAEDASDEAKTISDWISVSARDALESGYATKMIFGLSSDPDCRTILEEYVFMFKYDEAGNISLDGMEDGNSKKRTIAGAKPDVHSAKKQVLKLLRTIISITRTLESVPDERYVFCKMEFSEDCPEDYQPPGFVDAGDRSVGFFCSKPFAMKLGDVTTPYHNIALGLRTVLDAVDVDHNKPTPMGDDVSHWDTTEGSAGDEHGSQDENLEPQLRGRTNNDLTDLFSEPQETAPPAPAAKKAPGDEATERMLGLRLNEAPPPSLAGGIHSVPGSECTHSIAPAKPARKSGRNAAAAKQSDAMDCDPRGDETKAPAAKSEARIWPQSQVSGDLNKKRKVSIVDRPVHQDMKRRRAVVETQEDPSFPVPAPPPAKAAAAPPQHKSLRTTKRKSAANEH